MLNCVCVCVCDHDGKTNPCVPAGDTAAVGTPVEGPPGREAPEVPRGATVTPRGDQSRRSSPSQGVGVKTPSTWDPVFSSLDENILPFILKYSDPKEAITTGNTLTSKRLTSPRSSVSPPGRGHNTAVPTRGSQPRRVSANAELTVVRSAPSRLCPPSPVAPISTPDPTYTSPEPAPVPTAAKSPACPRRSLALAASYPEVLPSWGLTRAGGSLPAAPAGGGSSQPGPGGGGILVPTPRGRDSPVGKSRLRAHTIPASFCAWLLCTVAGSCPALIPGDASDVPRKPPGADP